MIRFWILSLVLNTAWGDAQLHVVVNSSANLREALTMPQLRDVFLKRKRFWTEKVKILPVDRGFSSPERRLFNSLVLGRTELELTEYWIQQRQINGTVPPLRIEDLQTVLDVVQSTEGAISYVVGDRDLAAAMGLQKKIFVFMVIP